MRSVRSLLVLAASLALSACSPPGGDSYCTLEARASVRVTVEDSAGNLQRTAHVSYIRDSDPEQDATCVDASGSPTGCGIWVAGWELAGDFLITATSADGTRTAQQQVHVDADECHVLTQTVKLTLPD